LVLLLTDLGLDLGHLEARHQFPPRVACPEETASRSSRRAAAAFEASPWIPRSCSGTTSAMVSPRRPATALGSSSCCSAATVAWTMLIVFDDPSDLLRTSWMPAHSRTARTGPPAMTPVPAAAGRSSTTPAAASPWTGCGMLL